MSLEDLSETAQIIAAQKISMFFEVRGKPIAVKLGNNANSEYVTSDTEGNLRKRSLGNLLSKLNYIFQQDAAVKRNERGLPKLFLQKQLNLDYSLNSSPSAPTYFN